MINNNVMRRILLIAFLSGVYVYFFIIPLHRWIVLSQLSPFELYNINDASKYYSFLSASFSSAIGIAGLLVGYSYYRQQRQHNERLRQSEYAYKRIDDIFTLLREYDDQVQRLLRKTFEDDAGLREIQDAIARKFDLLSIAINEIGPLIGMNDKHRAAFAGLFSVVDTNDILRQQRARKILDEELDNIEQIYDSRFRQVSIICYSLYSQHERALRSGPQ